MSDGSGFSGFMADIEKWADIWATAQASGTFDTPKDHVPTKKAVEDDYFGFHDARSTEIDSHDADVWLKVADLPGQRTGVLQEAKLNSPNPVPAWTVGPDSKPLAGETGPFFTTEDMERLIAMKLEIQRLQERVLTAEAKGGDVGCIGSKLDKLQRKIDDLSSSLSDYSTSDVPGRH